VIRFSHDHNFSPFFYPKQQILDCYYYVHFFQLGTCHNSAWSINNAVREVTALILSFFSYLSLFHSISYHLFLSPFSFSLFLLWFSELEWKPNKLLKLSLRRREDSLNYSVFAVLQEKRKIGCLFNPIFQFCEVLKLLPNGLRDSQDLSVWIYNISLKKNAATTLTIIWCKFKNYVVKLIHNTQSQ